MDRIEIFGVAKFRAILKQRGHEGLLYLYIYNSSAHVYVTELLIKDQFMLVSHQDRSKFLNELPTHWLVLTLAMWLGAQAET